MEHRWDDTDRRRPKGSEKKLSQCRFVHHKSHMDCPEEEAVCVCVCVRGYKPTTRTAVAHILKDLHVAVLRTSQFVYE
jgi:hypothetical protein